MVACRRFCRAGEQSFTPSLEVVLAGGRWGAGLAKGADLLPEPPPYDFGPSLWRGADIEIDAGSGDVVVIPDAAFLFNADFEKGGRDVLISGGDGRKAVVHDYYANAKRPAVASREGATIAGYLVDA